MKRINFKARRNQLINDRHLMNAIKRLGKSVPKSELEYGKGRNLSYGEFCSWSYKAMVRNPASNSYNKNRAYR